MNTQNPFDDAEIIFTYTRKDALADGSQIDVSTIAKEAGFKFPVFITRAVWDLYVTVPAGITDQDEQGRLWDVLMMLHYAIRRSNEGNIIDFKLYVRNSPNEEAAKLVTLKAECGPVDIDDPSPAITIMLPDED